jgi:uncharacterized protein YdhG (YjbR/CyaY superfamily)
MAPAKTPRSVDHYIAACAPEVQPILKKVRAAIRRAAPREAAEIISYRMPAFKLNSVLVYFAAFKKHLGLFPPVKGDAKLRAALRKYAGPKGNLKFSLEEPIPYALIARIVKHQVRRDRAKALLLRR